MKFRVSHVMHGISLPEYEALYFDEPFNEALCAHVKLGRKVLRYETKDGVLYRDVEVIPQRALPPVIQAFIKGEQMRYVEHIVYPMGSYRGQWNTTVPIAKDKIKSHGTVSFQAVEGGVDRVVEGEVNVSVLAVGGVIEKLIVGDAKRSYDDAWTFTEQWIREQRHKKTG